MLKICLCFIVLLSGVAGAGEPSPLIGRDLTPTSLLFAAPNDPGSLPVAGDWRADLSVDLANDYRPRDKAGELLLIDVETRRSTLRLWRGIDECWAAGLESSHIDHSGGDLDSFIEDWHDTFGLPQHGRDTAVHDRIHVYYQRDGEVLLDVRERVSGFGDTTLSLHRRQSCDGEAWQFGLKLPTGDADQLTGSGGIDVFAGAVRHGTFAPFGDGYPPFDLSGGAWLMWLGEGDLPLPQRDLVLFANGDIGWRVSSALQFNLQLQLHSPLYDSEVRELGGWSAGLLMGGQWHFAKDSLLEIAVMEDAYIQSTSDVIFHLALRQRF